MLAARILLLGLLLAPGVAAAFERTEQREPCADHDPLRQPFFGDIHVHTTLSLDASTQGTRNTPRDAYRFARGERLGIQPYGLDGEPLRHLKLDRPLDFAAVTDHAELFGERTICESPDLPGYSSPICFVFRRWPRLAFFLMNYRAAATNDPERYRLCGQNGEGCLQASLTPWRMVQEAAEEHYDRTAACRFTTFVGYEWTGSPASKNLHRNVIFRSAAVPRYPSTHFETPFPDQLNQALRSECIEGIDGCDALSIPHNSNLSGGLMFDTGGANDAPMSAEVAKRRHDMEPLVEIMQHKGDSECLLGAETTDELCGFEKLPYGTFAGKYVEALSVPPVPQSFVRNALGSGIALEEKLGVNPFQYGFVAGTDTHLGAPGAASDRDYPGHGGAGTPAGAALPPGLPDDIELNPGGLAVLWAEENSRDSLFEAMRRKETYATSGPRMVVRFFGGWDLPEDLCDSGNLVREGYQRGVPMGGDLPPGGGSAPEFAVMALRDATGGAPLERVQIIKVWLEGDQPREKVYDVARAPTNNLSLDDKTCELHGDGPARLCTVWRDPDFDPRQRALYYGRVVQTPTCRWSTWACNAAGVDCSDPANVVPAYAPCCDTRYPRTVQERAWTSPIWYSPRAGT